jgi:hypothetical protein
MGNRRLRQGAAALGLSAALLFATAGFASAGSPGFSIDPVSGPPGTVITATGTGCASQASGGTVDLALYSGDHDGYGVDATPIATHDGIPVEENGTDTTTWQGTITVPGDTAPGPLTVTAFCNPPVPQARRAGARTQGQGFYFQNQAFTVTAAATTTAAPTTTAPTTTTTAPSGAAPATAVPAQPTFTG